MASAALVSLMLADARLPTGAHNQSAGLEAAVKAGLGDEGRSLGDVRAYARDRLKTVVRVDAATAVVTRRTVLDGGDARDLVPAWAARTPSKAMRDASRRAGRGYLRLAVRAWPGVLDHLPPDAEMPRPVVMGTIAAVCGIDAAETARLVGYDDVQTVLSASLKLLPIDPADTVSWLVELADDIEALVAGVVDTAHADDIPADGAPMLDLLAERHATESRRLFHA